jgi:DHA1 family multidrug resistance protein-like MFS transporter
MEKLTKPLLLLMALSTLYSLGVGLLGPIYPLFVVNRFSASLFDFGIIYAIFCIVAALFKTVAGKLADAYGREIIFFTGVMMGAICTLGYIYVTNIFQLYIIEIFFGLSHALQRPSLLALMVDISDKNKRGMFFGMFESAYDITEAVAALLSTLIASKIGFEPLFYICSGCQLTTGLFILKYKK